MHGIKKSVCVHISKRIEAFTDFSAYPKVILAKFNPDL